MSEPVVERPRDRFDVPYAQRREQEKRLREFLAPVWAKFLPPHELRRALNATVPFLLDESARTAHYWLRQHQLGDKFSGWVEPPTTSMSEPGPCA